MTELKEPSGNLPSLCVETRVFSSAQRSDSLSNSAVVGQPEVLSPVGTFLLDELSESLTHNVLLEFGGTEANQSLRGFLSEPIRVGGIISLWSKELQRQNSGEIIQIAQINEMEAEKTMKDGRAYDQTVSTTRYVITTEDGQAYELKRLDLNRILTQPPMSIGIRPPLSPLRLPPDSKLHSFLISSGIRQASLYHNASVEIPTDFLNGEFMVFILPTRVTDKEFNKPSVFKSRGSSDIPIRPGSLFEFYQPNPDPTQPTSFLVHGQPRSRKLEKIVQSTFRGGAYRMEDEWGSVYYFFKP